VYRYGRVTDWPAVVNALEQSLFAEQLVCSMGTQLFYIPETADLEGNPEMHNHLVPASYHRVTAVGSAVRLAHGEFHESIVQTLRSCIQSAKREDEEVMRWLRVMRDAAPADFKPFLEHIIQWQEQAELSLRAAQQLLENM
jgi:hypothetical protein